MTPHNHTSFQFVRILYENQFVVVLRIYVALAIFQPYRDLKAEDNQSLKS